MKGIFLRKYGVEATIDFHLFEIDGVDFRVDAVHVAGDTKIMKDEGAEANTTNGFTDEGQGYSLVLTATEMQAARIIVYIVDAATKVWLDTAFVVETYGHASAMHAFDLDNAIANANVQEWLGTTVPTPNVAGRPVVSAGYEGEAVWINTLIANTNTVDHVDGTMENPVSTIAAATTIAVSLGIKKFNLMPGSSITLAQNYDNYIFDNYHATIALGGQSVNNAIFNGGVITGNDDGSNASPVQYCFCFMSGNTLGQFVFTDCYISGTITLAEAGTYRMHNCLSATAGAGSPNLDFGAGLAASDVNMRNYSGGIEIENMGAGAGTYNMSLEGNGQLIINANCSPTSNVSLRGDFNVTDNASAAVTVTRDDDSANIITIAADVANIDGAAMRGTDSAALASVATEARLAELDAANLPTDLAVIPTTAMRGTDNAALASVATEARLAELDAANLPTDIAAIPTTAMRGTDSAALASVATEARLAELDAANLPTDIAAIPTTAMRGTDSAALASVATEARLAELDAANLPADVDGIKNSTDRLPEAPLKNIALNDLTFLMVDETDHATPETGLTVTGQVSKDAGAFGAVAGSIAEISNGIYAIDATAADMNADILTFRFSAAGADDTFITMKTTS